MDAVDNGAPMHLCVPPNRGPRSIRSVSCGVGGGEEGARRLRTIPKALIGRARPGADRTRQLPTGAARPMKFPDRRKRRRDTAGTNRRVLSITGTPMGSRQSMRGALGAFAMAMQFFDVT